MIGDDFWRNRGFKPMPTRTYLKRTSLGLAATVALVLLFGLTGSFAPIGLGMIAFAAYQHRRNEAWWGHTTFSREDHPYLFLYIVGGGYVLGLLVTAFGLYQLGVRHGAV